MIVRGLARPPLGARRDPHKILSPIFAILPAMSRPTSITDLRDRMAHFQGRRADAPPLLTEPVQMRSPRPDPDPPNARAVPEARNALVLPYPAAVYRAAAEVLRLQKDSAAVLTLCVAPGPHVPGAGCPLVQIADLLEQVAEALQ